MKVNVAHYLIGDLSKQFPLSNGTGIDNDLIDVMVDKWSQHQYFHADASISFHSHHRSNTSYLM